jgi:hypothetical protein
MATSRLWLTSWSCCLQWHSALSLDRREDTHVYPAYTHSKRERQKINSFICAKKLVQRSAGMTHVYSVAPSNGGAEVRATPALNGWTSERKRGIQLQSNQVQPNLLLSSIQSKSECQILFRF